jgi:hypothetical protein
MDDKRQEKKKFTNLDFSELKVIKFKSHHEPRDATDYYYHRKSRTIYGWYWGGKNGRWEDKTEDIDIKSIKSPKGIKKRSSKSSSNSNTLSSENETVTVDSDEDATKDLRTQMATSKPLSRMMHTTSGRKEISKESEDESEILSEEFLEKMKEGLKPPILSRMMHHTSGRITHEPDSDSDNESGKMVKKIIVEPDISCRAKCDII